MQSVKPKTKTNKQHFQLIDGTFTPSEASRVLLSLVKSKMDHHRVEKFSNEERFGRDLAHSEKRLRELAELDRALKKLFGSISPTQNLKIKGSIEITFV